MLCADWSYKFYRVKGHAHCLSSRSLLTILNSESEDALQELAVTFTAQRSHFGSLHTEALEEGGEDKDVTMENRVEFVDKLCNWHLQSEYCY